MGTRKNVTVAQLTDALRRADDRFIDASELKQALADLNVVDIVSVKQTTTSSADGGANVMTVTLSDGSAETFIVKNGSKGSIGATGAAATINGVNALTLKAGNGISATQSGTTLTITQKLSPTAFTLAAASWVSGSGITAYPYKYVLSVSGVTAESAVNAVLSAASAAQASAGGMCACCESGAGTVTFYSRTKPTSALTGTLYYI